GTVARARPGRVARRAAEHRRPDLHRRPARTLPTRTALLGGVHGPLSPAGRAFGVRETRTTGGHASGDPVPAPRGGRAGRTGPRPHRPGVLGRGGRDGTPPRARRRAARTVRAMAGAPRPGGPGVLHHRPRPETGGLNGTPRPPERS